MSKIGRRLTTIVAILAWITNPSVLGFVIQRRQRPTVFVDSYASGDWPTTTSFNIRFHRPDSSSSSPVQLQARKSKKRVQNNAADHGKDWQIKFDRAVAHVDDDDNNTNWATVLTKEDPALAAWLADQQEQCRFVLGGQGKKGRITKKRAQAMERAGLLSRSIVLGGSDGDGNDTVGDSTATTPTTTSSPIVEQDKDADDGGDDDWRVELERLPDWRTEDAAGRGRVRRQNLNTVQTKAKKKKAQKKKFSDSNMADDGEESEDENGKEANDGDEPTRN